MRKVLLLITDLQIGGTPTVVRELALRLSAAGGAEVEVACLSPWGPVADQISQGVTHDHGEEALTPSPPYSGERAGLRGEALIVGHRTELESRPLTPALSPEYGGEGAKTLVVTPVSRPGVHVTALNARGVVSLPLVAWRLIRLIRSHQIDVVLSFLVHANVVAAIASFFCGRTDFLQSIQTTQPSPRWHWKAQALAGKRARQILVPTPSVAKAAADWASTPAKKLRVIPNAVDVDAFKTVAADRTQSTIPRVGFIGRLDPIKRIGDLLLAIELIDRPIHLHLFGEGAERAKIERQVAALKIGDRVTLHGAVAGPAEALKQIDILVLCSAAEGFGLVLIEAMAAGVPVVATDVPGIRDVVKNGETGLLVPLANPPKLALVIVSMLEDGSPRRAMIEHAAADVARRFSWAKVLPLYQRALGIE